MATARTATLEELTKFSTYFVTKQKGLWDHIAWMDFLSSVQHKARNGNVGWHSPVSAGDSIEAKGCCVHPISESQ
jgi:hypothetical protein